MENYFLLSVGEAKLPKKIKIVENARQTIKYNYLIDKQIDKMQQFYYNYNIPQLIKK